MQSNFLTPKDKINCKFSKAQDEKKNNTMGTTIVYKYL